MKRWIIGTLVVLSLILWFVVVWFAFPLVGFGEATPFEPIWVRILMISVVWLTVGIVYLFKFIRRRRAAKALEAALTEQEVTGDGEVLGEKMSEAMAVLKKSSGSKSFLYDLPWYIIIGPPGSGKTTALLNSGVKFPLAEKGEGAVAGVGGTRYCDWWFSEEAVLIDTAGRYTTQDSDAEADSKSWASFLKLLKTYRASQPINGVMLTISLQELMTASPAEIEAHAEIIRTRLNEINDELRVDFPVYVMFSKADLISGFMEFFGSFSQSRRQKVWGHTFQTESKKENTVERFDEEYKALVNRLSEEVTDRLQEEPDGINRIAIFSFPGQVAMLREKLGDFMRGVFGHTRYKVAANLRGFYFTSGTQEGTPIDQVLGAMQRNFGGMAAQGQLSGKAKSFFLHDLLKKVIFAEAGWVSTDKKAVRRQAILRYSSISLIVLATLGMLGLWGLSFYQNRQLIDTAEAAIADYELAAQDEINSGKVEDIDLLQVLPHLEMLRNMPMGYADTETEAPMSERFGLSQRGSVHSAATVTYRQALERMYRSRLILQLEQQLENFIRTGEVLAVYRTLKVYKLLGNLAPQSDDELIIGYFRDDWRRNTYQGTNPDTRAAMEAHLVAMLELDAAQQPSFELNGALIDQGERLLARMNVEDQAYSLILATAEFAGIEPFSIANRAGRDADLVFEGTKGQALDELVISPLYTYAGFHEFFLPQLSQIAENLLADQWVMGEYAADAQIEDQISGLGPILLQRYTNDWIEEWDRVLASVKLRPMSADRPSYQALAAASAPRTSPILLLTTEIMEETSLTAEYNKGEDEPPAGMDPDAVAGQAADAGGEFGKRAAQIFINRQSGLARIGLDVAFRKSQERAGTSGGSGGVTRLPGAEIEAYYADWHDLMVGDPPQRRIDFLIQTLGDMQRTLITAVDFPEVADREMPAKLGALKQASSRLPKPMERMIQEAVDDFEGDAANTNVARLNELLNQQVTQVCQAAVDSKFPFAKNSAREVGLVDFARLFAPQGVIDRFFLENLSSLANTSGSEWTWKDSGPLAGKLSTSTLKQFERAAAIRDAFFPTGGGIPQIDMEVVPTSLHGAVETAQLTVNGQMVLTRRKGNTPANITWPGSMAGANVELVFTPDMRGRKSNMSEGGSWAFVKFLDAGRPKVSGNVIQVRYTIDGRHIAYKMTLASDVNPFFMNELTEFKCPTGL